MDLTYQLVDCKIMKEKTNLLLRCTPSTTICVHFPPVISLEVMMKIYDSLKTRNDINEEYT
jgi:hypothetical protein